MLFRIWYSLILILIGLLSYRYYQNRSLILATENVCKLVNENFYTTTVSLDRWFKDCEQLAQLPFKMSKPTQIKRLQSHLASLGVSHLELWSPAEMSQMWLGEDNDTGIRVKQMENYWIVTEVFKQSPADGKIQVGDEIIAINGKVMLFSSDIEKASGEIEYWRNGKTQKIEIQASKITYPYQPHLNLLDPKKYKSENTAVLVLKSFTPVYFEDEAWKNIIRKTDNIDRLILDLRGNSGGDFVIMQKILSSFLCESTDIGYLIQPRKSNNISVAFTEDMDGSAQIEAVKNSSVVELRTYENYPCYLGELNVLMDRDTASTAEIFSEAIKLRKGTRLLGEQTSGAVLLAIWYPTLFGKQHSLSIPVALYKNWKDQIIEGEGIKPNRFLKYDVRTWRNGVDNWLLEASR